MNKIDKSYLHFVNAVIGSTIANRRRRLVSAQVDFLFYEMPKNRDSSLRTITKFIWHLGRYEPSSPSVKDLQGSNYLSKASCDLAHLPDWNFCQMFSMMIAKPAKQTSHNDNFTTKMKMELRLIAAGIFGKRKFNAQNGQLWQLVDMSSLLRLGKHHYWGASPALVVMGGDSCSKVVGSSPSMDGHFSHVFVVKNEMMFAWKDRKKLIKEAEVGPYLF